MKCVTDIPLQEIDRAILRISLPDLLEDAGEVRTKLDRLRCHCPVGGHVDMRGVLARRRKERVTTGRRGCGVKYQPFLLIGLRNTRET